jgi:hypothetical protein
MADAEGGERAFFNQLTRRSPSFVLDWKAYFFFQMWSTYK